MTKKILDIYSDYLICQNKYATATGLSDLLSADLSHDKITKYLNSEDLGSKELWVYVKPEIRKHELKKGGVLILDDSSPYAAVKLALKLNVLSSYGISIGGNQYNNLIL